MSSAVIFRSLEEAAQKSRACALAIGNFDGVHLGHQSLLRQTVELSRQRRVRPAVLTFHPHPTTIVAPHRVPLKLCSLEERLRLLEEAGAEEITVLPFTAEIARLSPQHFVQQVLAAALKARAVLVGENFRFGFQQAGTAETLHQIGLEEGFETSLLPPVLCRGEVVSSSAIRNYLLEHRIARANRLLGRPFSLVGPVVSGFGIGSKQTVPTLNLQPAEGQVTPNGVFITQTFDPDTGRRWQSITNIGHRPTFEGEAMTIETFLLSPFEEPTPKNIRVHLQRFVRPEQRFPDAASLRSQIMRDVDRAKTYWRRAASLRKAAPSIY